MKKQWTSPRVLVQAFEANEYVAACYNIKCNVPYGVGYYEKNGEPGYQKGGWFGGGDERIASGEGCGIMHYGVPGVPGDGPVANAMWQESRTGRYYPVYYWEQGNSSWGHSSSHFSKVEDAEWEPNPNAS